MPGTLTARISASPSPRAINCTTNSGSPFSSARGCLVSNANTGWGSKAHWYQSWGGIMSTPLYRRIAAELRHAISRGELPPGSQLPTEQELGDRYKVSRNTVRLALGLLSNEGIITSTPGRGTFVRDRIMLTYHASRAEAADRPDDWHTDAYFTEVRQQGRQPSQRFDMRIDPASLAVAQRLQVEEGAAVVVRRMIRYVDGEPWSIQDSS